MEMLGNAVALLFAADSIWSVAFRGIIWLAISLVIIVSTDSPRPEESLLSLKANLGFFLIFFILAGGLVGMLFGFTTA